LNSREIRILLFREGFSNPSRVAYSFKKKRGTRGGKEQITRIRSFTRGGGEGGEFKKDRPSVGKDWNAGKAQP